MKSIEINGQQFVLGSRFARCFAQLLDFFILFLPMFLVAGIFGGGFNIPLFYPRSPFMLSLMAIWFILYFPLQDGLNNGRSFGKRIMSMRVVDVQTGAACRYWKSIIRNLFPFVILFYGFLVAAMFEPTLGDTAEIFAIAGLFIFHIDAIVILGGKRQRLSDKVAKTYVVKGNPPKDGIPAAPPRPVKTFLIGMGILVGLGTVGFAFLPQMPYGYTSSDGLVQITAPLTWDDMTNYKQTLQMEDATLVISDESRDLWVMVISKTKEELGMIPLNRFDKLTTDQIISNLSEVVSVGDPVQVTLDGHTAIQYEIQGVVESDNVTYLHTSVESKHHYHQIVGFTMRTQRLSDKLQLQKIVESFKEIR